jgi:hypothetical protein
VAAARGVSVSQAVRELLGLVASDSDERVDGLERRVSRLEELAGL